MKLISETLSAKGLNVNDLPSSITSEIDELREMIVKYNEACDEYDLEEDKDPQTEKRLDAMEDAIAEFETGIAKDIKDLDAQQQQQEQVSADGTKTEEQPEEKKKDSSLSWLLFGGVALALTLGAVNVFKKK
jgi:chromosome segregation ATPase